MDNYQQLLLSIKSVTEPPIGKPSKTYLELVKLFPLRSIEFEEDYKIALSVIEKIMNFLMDKKNSDEGIKIYLKTLSDLVSHYESAKFKSSTVSEKEMLAYLMELQG